MDAAARSKNGHPAHNTTGDASTSSTHVRQPPPMESIASASSGAVRMTAATKRRFMSAYSGFGGASSVVNSAGSRAMPHFGHDPGPIFRTSGCIGQVYSTPATTGSGSRGFKYRIGSASNLATQPFEQK